ncbi:hypothetical protein G7Z17_g3540 [Cylindrodendrum hubeiense]|uniref:Uncharacterized protein n=1 Tax=Cylindrodendrum hubeiense TaxID=595255 RepID=A0A9P5LDG4_9HYPO|nr:hypothetical protein G7Z17_g3540 [Cylindrodendrum hubeiense]
MSASTRKKLGMLTNGIQAADFLEVLRPTLDSSEFAGVKVTCCDGIGWDSQQQMLKDIQSVNAEKFMDVVSSHGYSAAPGDPFNTTLSVLQTEWANIFSPWSTGWDTGADGDGLLWASRI